MKFLVHWAALEASHCPLRLWTLRGRTRVWLGTCTSQASMREATHKPPKALLAQSLPLASHVSAALSLPEAMNREDSLAQNLVCSGGMQREGQWPKGRQDLGEPGRPSRPREPQGGGMGTWGGGLTHEAEPSQPTQGLRDQPQQDYEAAPTHPPWPAVLQRILTMAPRARTPRGSPGWAWG